MSRKWRAVDCRHQKNGHIRIFANHHVADREAATTAREYGCIANVLRSHVSCEANARLIEAAPALLETGKELLRVLDDITPHEFMRAQYMPAFIALRDAVIRAEVQP